MPVPPILELILEAQAAFQDRHGVPLTQADIARISGLSPQRVSQLFAGEVKALPPMETINRLAQALKVSPGLVLQRYLESTGYDIPDDFPVAARKGVPKQRLIDAAEPDPNVDPPGPEHGA